MPFKDTLEGQTHSFDLKYCKRCNQMTNHIGDLCQKCLENTTSQSSIEKYISECDKHIRSIVDKPLFEYHFSEGHSQPRLGVERDIQIIIDLIGQSLISHGASEYKRGYDERMIELLAWKKTAEEAYQKGLKETRDNTLKGINLKDPYEIVFYEVLRDLITEKIEIYKRGLNEMK